MERVEKFIEETRSAIKEKSRYFKLFNFILFLGLIFIGSIILSGATSATAINNSTIYVSIQGNDTWNGLSATYNNTSGYGPKATVANATGSVANNGTVYIASGTYNENNITINSNVTITGESQQNTIINGKSQGNSIFIINPSITIIFEDITLINAKTNDGGGIYNNGNLNVNNCTFSNNIVYGYGGAIYNNQGNLTLNNCTFTSNTADVYAGAIYDNGKKNADTLIVNNSTFTDNVGYGIGAIDNTGYLNLTNSTFNNNSGEGEGVGAINNYGILNIINNTFNNDSGGAIYNNGNLNVTSSTFTNCAAPNGGAILNYHGTLTVNNCTFTGNNAIGTESGNLYIKSFGGAIDNYYGILNVTGCTFTNNTAKSDYFSYGGAIYNEGDIATVNHSTFTNNTVISDDEYSAGGAIYNGEYGTLNVTNSTFITNNATGFNGGGGAIFNWGTLNITANTFTNNTATSEAGGAIFNTGSLNVTGSNFIGNDATTGGGAIEDGGGSLNVSGSTFTKNTTNSDGGAIDNYGTANVNFNRIVGNTATKGSAIYNGGTLNAQYNWWGSNVNPTSQVYGNVSVTPWLILTLNASSTIIKANGTSIITADLQHDSNGIYHNPTNGHVPNGIPVKFTTTLGTIGTQSSTVNGSAQSTLKAGSVNGTANVSAKMDNQTVSTLVTIDTIPPKVTAVNPVNGSVNIANNTTIKITFSKPVKAGTNWFVFTSSNGTAITFKTSINGTVLTITPTNPLTNDTKYSLTLHTGSVTDLAGNPLAIWSSSFSVGPAPTIKSVNPLNGALNVSTNRTFTITFNEPIKAGNLSIQFENSSGTAIPFTTSINGNTLTITPKTSLTKSIKYTIILHTGCVTDQAGNPLALTSTSFTTTKI